MSTRCPLHCDFCYHLGNPPEVITGRIASLKTPHMVRELCRQIAAGNYPAFDDRVGEYFANPHILDNIRVFREYFPDDQIDFTTSGFGLTEDRVAALATLQPVFLQVSLNTADAATRRRIMKDPMPEVAIAAIRHLCDYRVPFSGTIVAWPGLELDDIANTIRYLDAHQAVSIKINLPSYTRFFPISEDFDTFETWSRLTELVRGLRREVATPVTWEPYFFDASPFDAVVVGVVRNSPAARAGLRPGDRLLEIDGETVVFLEQARRLLIRRDLADDRRRLTVDRDGCVVSVDLVEEGGRDHDDYPHKPRGHSAVGRMFGVFLHQGLDLFALGQVRRRLAERPAGRTLLLTSTLLAPQVEALFAMAAPLGPGEVTVSAAPNRYFGGNVMIGDLLVASDIVEAIRLDEAAHGTPDLIVVPGSSFNDGRDLVGAPTSDIVTATSAEVMILSNARILV
ncbi:radical SAM protein [Rhodoplanes sp.]|uniref:radical SAM protein n=1 Tax=Rhodoplanes sp. TaxID=1968906 RepID=UPI0025FD6489|nr:radical SAM protein [Rhodoplanes sp.]